MKWRSVKKHINQPILVKFLDHAMGASPVECSVVGYLSFMDAKHIKIVSWDCNIPEPDRSSNIEFFSILKSTVLEIYPLTIAKKFG